MEDKGMDKGTYRPTTSKKAQADDISVVRPKAEQGDRDAEYDLGLAYSVGRGVTRDPTEAAKWYRKAAEQGHIDAQYELGMSHYKGQGVPQDYAEAHKWFSVAAQLASDGKTQKRCADMRTAAARQMSAQQIGEAQKRAREWLTAFEPRK